MKSHAARLILVAFGFALGFTLISARLVYLQLVRHDDFRKKAIEMHYAAIPIPPLRGRICDRNGSVLAQSVIVTDLRIDGKLMYEKPESFDKLAGAIGMSVEELRKFIKQENRYQLVEQNLSTEKQAVIKALNLKAVILQERSSRVYPNGHEASHLIGFVNTQSRSVGLNGMEVEFEAGVDGVERSMDHFLRGIAGERRVARNAARKEVAAFRQFDRPARQGLDVMLTTDQVIQHIVENEADKLMEAHHPDALHIIVMRPATGEILALVNRPTFDPNDRCAVQLEQLKNVAIMNTYEPGSTFKIVTLAAALNENAAHVDMPIFCENGQFLYAGTWLHDHHPYGLLTLRQVMAKSSNIGFAKLAILLGKETVHDYAAEFGFGQASQKKLVVLKGEEKGVLRSVADWSNLSITHVPMGYEVAVTNLQMAMAYAAIANGGRLMEPRFVKAVTMPSGAPVVEYMPRAVRQVIRPEVATQIRDILKDVVSDEGTAARASVPGFVVAGKTGTAQKLVGGRYDRKHYIASFIGFLPADQPEFLVSIVVDDPHGNGYYGGLVAAPAFSAIASQTADQLRLQRSVISLASSKEGAL